MFALCCKNLHYVFCISKTTNALWFTFFFVTVHLCVTLCDLGLCFNDPKKNWNVVHLVPFAFHQLTWTSARNRKNKIHLFYFYCMYFFIHKISPLYPLFKFYIKPIPGQLSLFVLIIFVILCHYRFHFEWLILLKLYCSVWLKPSCPLKSLS